MEPGPQTLPLLCALVNSILHIDPKVQSQSEVKFVTINSKYVCMSTSFSSPASIVDCGDPPILASGVIVEAYNSTLVNSDIFFQCQQPGLVPSYHNATCESDGRWNSDPSQVECRMVIPTTTGTTIPNCTCRYSKWRCLMKLLYEVI